LKGCNGTAERASLLIELLQHGPLVGNGWELFPAVFFFTSNGKRKAAASEGSPLANRAASGAPTTKAGHVMTSKPEPVTGRIE